MRLLQCPRVRLLPPHQPQKPFNPPSQSSSSQSSSSSPSRLLQNASKFDSFDHFGVQVEASDPVQWRHRRLRHMDGLGRTEVDELRFSSTLDGGPKEDWPDGWGVWSQPWVPCPRRTWPISPICLRVPLKYVIRWTILTWLHFLLWTPYIWVVCSLVWLRERIREWHVFKERLD